MNKQGKKLLSSILTVGYCFSVSAMVEVQIVKIEQQQYLSKVGETLTIPVIYSNDTNDAQLSDLGLRIHWNSTKLNYVRLDNLLNTALIQTGQVEADLDNDPNTDKSILVAWAELSQSNWPALRDTLTDDGEIDFRIIYPNDDRQSLYIYPLIK